MISEPRLKAHIVLNACALAGSAAFGYQAEAASWWAFWGLIGVVALADMWRNLNMLARLHAPAVQPASALAEEAPARVVPWIENAPLALFSFAVHDGAHGAVEPLNAIAHRVIAPGRMIDTAALYAALYAQQPGGSAVVWYETEQGMERALVSASSIVIDGERRNLLALMPVENELEAETLGAWRELTHVLTHEIMNSLTPIASLSRTAQELRMSVAAQLPADVDEDLALAFDTIAERADSLKQFVNSYRTLSNAPAPKLETVALEAAFARLALHVAPDWQARGGEARFSVDPPGLTLRIDPGQFEQAMLNLLRNAADATAGVAVPQLTVSACLWRENRVRIVVIDNGPGVPEHLAAQIFTPFFSTKEHGSGIGLAMVRQLLHANGGTVRHARPLQGGAQFVLLFQDQQTAG